MKYEVDEEPRGWAKHDEQIAESVQFSDFRVFGDVFPTILSWNTNEKVTFLELGNKPSVSQIWVQSKAQYDVWRD